MSDSTDERWLPVAGWEDLYEVSNWGRVRSLDRWSPDRWGTLRHFTGKILKATLSGHGYPVVSLRRPGVYSQQLVHRIALAAFVGPCPDGMECCHNNGDRTDARIENLRWDTPSENQRDAVRHGTHSEGRKTHCPQGHPYDDENTYVEVRNGRPRRHCRICRSEQVQRWNARQRKAA